MTAGKTLCGARRPKGVTRHRRLRPSCLALLGFLPICAHAQELPRTIFGSVGLIEMPTARMAPDGELAIGGSYFSRTQHYNMDFQLLPWMETSFRYSGLNHFYPGYTTFYDRSFAVKVRLWDETDVAPAVAIGINDVGGTGIYGGEYLVASKQFGAFDASLGMGWGRLGSTDLFKNPLGLIFKSFNQRGEIVGAGNTAFNTFFRGPYAGLFGGVSWATPVDGLTLLAEYSSDRYVSERASGNFTPTSQVNLGARYSITDSTMIGADWFHGSGVTGSIDFILDPVHQEYPHKIAPPPKPRAFRTDSQQRAALELMMHRNATVFRPRLSQAQLNQARTSFGDTLVRSNPDVTDIRISGRALMLKLDKATPERCHAIARIAQQAHAELDTIFVTGAGATSLSCQVDQVPELVEVSLTSPLVLAPEENDTNAPSISDPAVARRAIIVDARKQKIDIVALRLGPSEATVYYRQFTYFSELEAVGRLTRILMADTPSSIEKFHLIAMPTGIPQRTYDVLRAPMERSMAQNSSASEILGTAITSGPAPMDSGPPASAMVAKYPQFSWDIAPGLHEALFDPVRPLGLQLYAGVSGVLDFGHGLSLQGEAELNLFDNFFLGRESDSVLPHVRTDYLKYFVDGKNGIGDLQADYRFRLAPSVFAVARAGILESMFSGSGGEVLWRPEGERWALGVDGYEVWQRNFDRLFGVQPYHVFTGHVSLYYDSPWYDLNFMLSAGQYLAGDRGLTFQMSRRFDTGVEIGVWATKTNVSSTDFGEGSFDKGFFIRIPISWLLPLDSQREIDLPIRPVQRDGGQRLLGDATLYEETRRTSEDDLRSHLDTDVFE